MMPIQNGLDMANLTRDYLKYIKTIEEPIMHHHLSELKHPQWGSIIGYENEIRLAVLKDEVEEWEKRVGDDPDHIPYLGYIRDTLKSRFEELEEKEIVVKRPAAVSVLKESGEERVDRWKREVENSSTEEKKHPEEMQ